MSLLKCTAAASHLSPEYPINAPNRTSKAVGNKHPLSINAPSTYGIQRVKATDGLSCYKASQTLNPIYRLCCPKHHASCALKLLTNRCTAPVNTSELHGQQYNLSSQALRNRHLIAGCCQAACHASSCWVRASNSETPQENTDGLKAELLTNLMSQILHSWTQVKLLLIAAHIFQHLNPRLKFMLRARKPKLLKSSDSILVLLINGY